VLKQLNCFGGSIRRQTANTAAMPYVVAGFPDARIASLSVERAR